MESELWDEALKLNSLEAYQRYLSSYPSGVHAVEAANAIVRIQVYASKDRDSSDWSSTLAQNNVKAFQDFIQSHPCSPHLSEARQRLDKFAKKKSVVVWSLTGLFSLSVLIVVIFLLASVTYLTASKQILSFDGDGGQETLTISTDGKWKIVQSTDDWAKLSVDSPDEIAVTVEANPLKEARKTSFILGAGIRRCKVSINQGRKVVHLSLDKNSVEIPGSGGEAKITVTSNEWWEVVETPSWLTVSKVEECLRLSSARNDTNEDRVCTIRIIADDKDESIYVTQRTCNTYLQLSTSRLHLNNSGDYQTVTIYTDGGWSHDDPVPDWLFVTHDADNLIVSALKNEGASKECTLVIKAGAFSKYLRVSQAAAGPEAAIETIWVDHNVYEYGQKGMRIHLKFTTERMMNLSGIVSCYFYYSSSGEALVDRNSDYRTTNGKVAVSERFTPGYESSIYNDFTIFMPYSELHLSSTSSCYFSISIWYKDSVIATSPSNTYFSYTIN